MRVEIHLKLSSKLPYLVAKPNQTQFLYYILYKYTVYELKGLKNSYFNESNAFHRLQKHSTSIFILDLIKYGVIDENCVTQCYSGFYSQLKIVTFCDFQVFSFSGYWSFMVQITYFRESV